MKQQSVHAILLKPKKHHYYDRSIIYDIYWLSDLESQLTKYTVSKSSKGFSVQKMRPNTRHKMNYPFAMQTVVTIQFTPINAGTIVTTAGKNHRSVRPIT